LERLRNLLNDDDSGTTNMLSAGAAKGAFATAATRNGGEPFASAIPHRMIPGGDGAEGPNIRCFRASGGGLA
jgi:hypothetical protein